MRRTLVVVFLALPAAESCATLASEHAAIVFALSTVLTGHRVAKRHPSTSRRRCFSARRPGILRAFRDVQIDGRVILVTSDGIRVRTSLHIFYLDRLSHGP